jgi:hypothetical protein
MLTIRATDHDVTVWSDERILGQYPFGLTGSDLFQLLEELGIEADYQYHESGPRALVQSNAPCQVAPEEI